MVYFAQFLVGFMVLCFGLGIGGYLLMGLHLFVYGDEGFSWKATGVAIVLLTLVALFCVAAYFVGGLVT